MGHNHRHVCFCDGMGWDGMRWACGFDGQIDRLDGIGFIYSYSCCFVFFVLYICFYVASALSALFVLS